MIDLFALSGLWFLSFASAKGFLGGVLVKADDLKSAITRATLLGLNPGGECLGYPIPAMFRDQALMDYGLERRVSEAEAKAAGKKVSEMSEQELKCFNENLGKMGEATIPSICEQDNPVPS